MARTSDDRSLFLQMLAEHPFIYLAAKKAGISPATIHRWMKSNKEFAQEVRRVKREGLANQNEMVESRLVKESLSGNVPAIRFYLTHNSSKYRPKKPDWPPPPISAEARDTFMLVHDWAIRNESLPPDVRERIWSAWRRFGYVNESGELTDKFREEFGYLTKDWEAERRRKK